MSMAYTYANQTQNRLPAILGVAGVHAGIGALLIYGLASGEFEKIVQPPLEGGQIELPPPPLPLSPPPALPLPLSMLPMPPVSPVLPVPAVFEEFVLEMEEVEAQLRAHAALDNAKTAHTLAAAIVDAERFSEPGMLLRDELLEARKKLPAMERAERKAAKAAEASKAAKEAAKAAATKETANAVWPCDSCGCEIGCIEDELTPRTPSVQCEYMKKPRSGHYDCEIALCFKCASMTKTECENLESNNGSWFCSAHRCGKRKLSGFKQAAAIMKKIK